MEAEDVALAVHTADICRELTALLTSLPDTQTLQQGVLDAAARLAAGAHDPRSLPAYAAQSAGLLSEHDVPVDRSPVTARINPLAPPADIEVGDGWAQALVAMPRSYQGPRGRVHGGFVAVLLDHVMGNAAHSRETRHSYTRYLNVTYDAGTPTEEQLTVRGAVVRQEGRKTLVEGSISAGGRVTVRAEGLWVAPRPD